MAIKYYNKHSLSGSCRTFSSPKIIKQFWGSPSRSVTRSCYTALNLIIILGFTIVNLLNVFSTFIGFSNSPASALSYSSNNGNSNSIMSFTFNLDSNLAISVSGDLNIADLSPGSSSDSNIITVGVNTNNATGYSLSATVGNESNPTTDLVHGDDISSNISNSSSNNSNGNAKFTSLSPGDSLINLTTDNTWGYSYSIDTNSTNSSNTAWSNYSGLPIYTSPGTVLKEAYTPTIDTINFKIGAKASNTQVSGTYTNVVNFTAISFPTSLDLEASYAYFNKSKISITNPTTSTTEYYYAMQDMSPSICGIAEIGSNLQVVDIRDNEIYHIAKLKDSRCWLLDNLRLNPTDPAVAAVLSEDNTNAPDNAIYNYLHGGNPDGVEGWSSEAVSQTWPNIYIKPTLNINYKNEVVISYGIGSGKTGVYYNYCAVTVGTYCYDSGQGVDLPGTLIDAPYDVCAAGWRIPTGGANGEYGELYASYDNDPAKTRNAASLLLSGVIDAGHQNQSGSNSYGLWWASTWYNANDVYRLATYYDGGLYPVDLSNRRPGTTVRCIAK